MTLMTFSALSAHLPVDGSHVLLGPHSVSVGVMGGDYGD